MKIKRLAPEKCPQCGAERTQYVADDERITCRLCGFKLARVADTVTPPPSPKPKKYPITYGKIHIGSLDPWADSAYNTAITYLQQDKIEDAVKAFQRAVDNQADFLDAHLWLGRLLDDPEKKRHHFGEIVAVMPNHLEAIRELMVLNGDLTREEADRSLDTPQQAPIRQPNMPVEATTTVIECPICGGGMLNKGDGSAECKHCGYRTTPTNDRGYGMKMLTMEVLKRRGQSIQWQVGERFLQCDNCGAETIIQGHVLATNCPFCASKHVVERDALQSFVQPDGIVPFDIDETEARQALTTALNSRVEKVVGWFINNKVADLRLTSTYLPFWLYDITLLISRTTLDRRTSLYEDVNLQNAYRHEQFSSGAFDEAVCGVESLPQRLLERLSRYDLGRIQPYDPVLLASHTAQLYTLDFERGSMRARQRVSERMRQDFGHRNSPDVTVTVQSLVQTVQFRLVLMPLWVATLTERDGDVRLGLIHGQSAQVVLGEALKKGR